ncbi:MAG TPA: aminotransferase class I/II-fold pyridoxal phosphate-dependent enzyme [Vicinamibacteria bacterium]
MTAHYAIRGRRAQALVESIEAGVREGRLLAGAPLPTVRALAGELGVSPTTVAAAYRALRARGVLSARGRLGTRVSARPPLPAAAQPPLPSHLRNLAEGNPDPRLLPRLKPPALPRRPRLYGEEHNLPELVRLAARQLSDDGIPAGSLAVVGGAMDGIERVLQAHLRPGDVVAVEDPGFFAVFDLVAALGLVAEPVAVRDEAGVAPEALEQALRAGARAAILTPRAQNPTGAAWDEARARELRALLARHPDLLVIEDDHAGPVAGAPALTLAHPRRARWAVVRSVSKSLGPDLRLAALAADPLTVGRVEGRQALGVGWVSHVLQRLVAHAWAEAAVQRQLATAAATYTARREELVRALARHGISAHGRSGLNVWIPCAEEAATVAALAEAGWAVQAGERYRLESPPAMRVTVASLEPGEVPQLAQAIGAALRPQRRAPSR